LGVVGETMTPENDVFTLQQYESDVVADVVAVVERVKTLNASISGRHEPVLLGKARPCWRFNIC
jgi:hypothetical protein